MHGKLNRVYTFHITICKIELIFIREHILLELNYQPCLRATIAFISNLFQQANVLAIMAIYILDYL